MHIDQESIGCWVASGHEHRCMWCMCAMACIYYWIYKYTYKYYIYKLLLYFSGFFYSAMMTCTFFVHLIINQEKHQNYRRFYSLQNGKNNNIFQASNDFGFKTVSVACRARSVDLSTSVNLRKPRRIWRDGWFAISIWNPLWITWRNTSLHIGNGMIPNLCLWNGNGYQLDN